MEKKYVINEKKKINKFLFLRSCIGSVCLFLLIIFSSFSIVFNNRFSILWFIGVVNYFVFFFVLWLICHGFLELKEVEKANETKS